jgi:GNAT superfamily N-acetyltransferase
MQHLRFVPLTPEHLPAIARLFDGDSTTRGCHCMWWRVSSGVFGTMSRSDRADAFAQRVHDGPPPGLIAFDPRGPAGWVQVTPRPELPRFNAARTARPATDLPAASAVWVTSCFFVRRDLRRQGVMTMLARAACRFAATQGADAVEAAALDPQRPLQRGEGFVGLVAALERAGFVPVERRSAIRLLMRWTPDARE